MPEPEDISPSRRVKVVQRRLTWVIKKILSDLDGRVDARVWESLTRAKKEINFSIVLMESLETRAKEPFQLT